MKRKPILALSPFAIAYVVLTVAGCSSGEIAQQDPGAKAPISDPQLADFQAHLKAMPNVKKSKVSDH
jgi:hypothetical protein